MFLNEFLVIVSSSELSAFEHRKLWCLQTLCWLHGERSLPIGRLVLILANSEDPDEMQHYAAAFHLGLHCLPNSHFGVSSIPRVERP